jgi:proteasome accessory factor C
MWGGRVDRFHRYYYLHRILTSRRLPVSRAALERELECSRATVKRIVEELRNIGAPIEYIRDQNGYRYTPGVAFELPGIWFTPSELEALFVAEHLLERAEPGLLADTLGPLRQKLQKIFALEHLGRGELARRVRILRMGGRGAGRYFNVVADALTRRKRLFIEYHSRSTDEVTAREISPQRLVHYRDNWYLDAWCHMRKALRSFAIERIRTIQPRDRAARNIPDRKLDAHFAAAYGIFAGTPKQVAVLRFSAKRARWVADEQWHPKQESRFLPDGSYELRVPYGDPRELVGDLLRHGPEVEVVSPAALRAEVTAALERALNRYRLGTTLEIE